jgi:hypothetical protein
MRGVRLTIIALLMASASVASVAPMARADSFHRDPDDTPTSFDIRMARTVSHGLRHTIVFRTAFYDVIQWRRNTELWIYIDSRAGTSHDYLLVGSMSHDVAHCDLYSRDGPMRPVGGNVGPRRVTCWTKKRLLHSTHTVRFKLRAISWMDGAEVQDWAPGRFSGWYPHV